MDDMLRFEFPVEIKNTRHIMAKRKQAMRNHSRLCQSLILVHQINTMLKEGKAQSFEQISQWLGISSARLSQVLNLLLLSPQIQEVILFSKEMTLTESAIREITLLPDWEEQAKMWVNSR